MATLTRKRHRGRPWTKWSDSTSDLALSRLGVKPGELSEIAFDHVTFRILLRILPRDPPQRKSGYEDD